MKPGALAEFPGIESYCDYLEHIAFQPLMESTFGLIWGLISYTDPKEAADCWDWSLAVLQAIQSEEQPDISIHDIFRRLQRHGGDPVQSLGRGQDKGYLYIAIFGVLCWSSLVVRPRLSFRDGVAPNLTCLLPHGFKSTANSTTHRLSDRCMRPILTTFRPFKLQHWGDWSDERTQGGARGTDSLTFSNGFRASGFELPSANSINVKPFHFTASIPTQLRISGRIELPQVTL
ncbi:hypothetical protein ACJZ2D_010849 [Fusarium nematophilum]